VFRVERGLRRPAHGAGGLLVFDHGGAGEDGRPEPPQPADRAGARRHHAGAEHGAGDARGDLAVGRAGAARAAGAARDLRVRRALLLLHLAGAPPARGSQPHPVHQPGVHRHPGGVAPGRAHGAARGAVRCREPGGRRAGRPPRLAPERRPHGGEPARGDDRAGRCAVQRPRLRHHPPHQGREPAG
ncbi:MAG: Permease of the drug/metabolite transporter (DMT) superfamily, partial [uncultured Gemmatimonadetes bacterium]